MASARSATPNSVLPCVAHNSCKLKQGALGVTRQLISAVLQERSQSNKDVPLWVRYNGGRNPGTVRVIYPQRWISEPY